MSNNNTLEAVFQEMGKIANYFLSNQGSFEQMRIVCRRFLALGEYADFPKIIRELSAAFASLEDKVTKLKFLFEELKKHGK